MTALLVDHPYIYLRNPTNNPTCQMKIPTNSPTTQQLIDAARRNNYMPDPNIPLHKQSLLSVMPPTPEDKAEADWELPEEPIHNHNQEDRFALGNQILEAEIDPDADAAYDLIKAEREATTAKVAATVRQLQQDQADRFRAEYPEYSQPEPVRSDSYNKVKRIVG